MSPEEVVILCGEWETGPAPQTSSGEKYNVVLDIREIVRHPEFDAGGLGVEGGNDLAVFKIEEQGLTNSSALGLNPICLPDSVRPNPTEGVQSGWSNPPPLYYFRDFGPGFLPFVTDTFKQWHYKLKIEDNCREANRSEYFGRDVAYPSKAFYPPGLICAKDVTSQFCPTAGDSGSPLMVKDNQTRRFYVEGVLSFLKGCDAFSMGPGKEEKTKFEFVSFTESPLAYTKMSCFLPWVAKQFGLSYDDHSADDESCLKGSGQKPPFNSTHQYNAVCRETVGEIITGERPCVFPFYYKDKLYNRCALLETSNFVVPVWRCPTHNIATKYKDTGINHFTDDIELRKTYCHDYSTCTSHGPGCIIQLDPEIDCPDWYRLPAFSTCKSDCPGGKYFQKVPNLYSVFSFAVRGLGIIGGGAVLFTASALAGQAVLPMIGETWRANAKHCF